MRRVFVSLSVTVVVVYHGSDGKMLVSISKVYSIAEICHVVFPPFSRGQRFIAVIRAYCDESYDKAGRVYSLAGFAAKDKEWTSLQRRWRNRCLRDGIQCYHAADCEGAYGEFAGFSKERIVSLNTDLITHAIETRLVGFGVSIFLEDYEIVRGSSDKAKKSLPESPYFFAMWDLVLDMCNEVVQSRPNYHIAFIFDQHEEFGGRAKQFHDQLRAGNPALANCMGTITYADKRKFVPLQVADKLAYEIMKHMLNSKYDPSRKERIALTRMKEGRIIQTIRYVDHEVLRNEINS